MGLFETIEEEYDDMSPHKQLIAKYLVDNWMDAAFSTVREIAKKLDVSEALIIRFSTELGYSGFKEIQTALRDHIRIKLKRIDRITNIPKTSENGWTKRIFDIDIQNLIRTFESNTEEMIKLAAEILYGARNIYTVGDRNAGAIAILAGIHFNEVLGNALPLVGIYGNSADYLRHADSRDCIFAISLPEYSNYTMNILETAKDKGVQIISVTDSMLSDLVKISDVVLLTACDTMSFNFSHCGTVALIDALIVHLTMLDMARSTENVSAIEGITKERLGILKE